MNSREVAETLWRASNVWVECTKSPIGGGKKNFYKLGENLVSRTRGSGGRRNYAFMLKPVVGDPVIHVLKKQPNDWIIVGVSVVKSSCVKHCVEETGERYFIGLDKFSRFGEYPEGIDLQSFVGFCSKEIRDDISKCKAWLYPFELRSINGRKKTIVLSQRYLSLGTRTIVRALLDYLDESVGTKVNWTLDDDISGLIKRARNEKLDQTTVNRLVDARRGQGRFRSELDYIWKNNCAVLGCSTREMLRASHIKPWHISNDEQRLDPENGILLAAHLDALFDSNLISFADDGRMLISDHLEWNDRRLLMLDGCRLRKEPSTKMKEFLTFHRNRSNITDKELNSNILVNLTQQLLS